MKSRYLLAAVAASFAGAAGAQSLKPGLWEMTNKVQMSGESGAQMAQMQQQMANMPPDQRRMVEEMMKKQGVQMGTGPGGGMSVKICMTKEMVERDQVSSGQQRGDCQTTQYPRTGNTMKMAFTCTNPPSKGEGQVTFHGPDSYSMKMVVDTQVQGKPERVNMEGTSKWLGADCGTVKPIAMPKK
jgi:hypothetical protein